MRAAGWEVNVTRRPLYKPTTLSKTRHFLDTVMRPVRASAALAHGIIGQSFRRTEKVACVGGVA